MRKLARLMRKLVEHRSACMYYTGTINPQQHTCNIKFVKVQFAENIFTLAPYRSAICRLVGWPSVKLAILLPVLRIHVIITTILRMASSIHSSAQAAD
jgi:hypothetical protein